MPDRDGENRRSSPARYGAGLLVGIIIVILALLIAQRPGFRAADLDVADKDTLKATSHCPWQADLPDNWQQVPGVDGTTRFVMEGLTVGGIERLPGLPEGEWNLASLLPDDREILTSTQVAVAAGCGVVFDISVPVQPNSSSSEKSLELGESQPYMPVPTRPETHCLIPFDGVTWDIWTRENAGFSPLAARDAAFSILQSLRWAGQSGLGKASPVGEVKMIAVKSDEVYPDGRVWGAFDVEITVCNTSETDPYDLKILVAKVISNPSYSELDTGVDTNWEWISALDPGASRILSLTGLEVGHPEDDYEIIADVVGGGCPLKLGVRMAFPPGSED